MRHNSVPTFSKFGECGSLVVWQNGPVFRVAQGGKLLPVLLDESRAKRLLDAYREVDAVLNH